jgi:hypothetical protein
MLVIPLPHRRDLRRDHRALAFVEVPAAQVLRDHKPAR